MRFDTPVYFQRIQSGAYDPNTGDYGPDIFVEEMRRASVTDSATQTLQLLYGELRQGCKTIRIQMPYRNTFDRIRIGKKVYRVDLKRDLRTKQTFVVSEVQGSGTY